MTPITPNLLQLGTRKYPSELFCYLRYEYTNLVWCHFELLITNWRKTP